MNESFLIEQKRATFVRVSDFLWQRKGNVYTEIKIKRPTAKSGGEKKSKRWQKLRRKCFSLGTFSVVELSETRFNRDLSETTSFPQSKYINPITSATRLVNKNGQDESREQRKLLFGFTFSFVWFQVKCLIDWFAVISVSIERRRQRVSFVAICRS